MIWGSVLGGTTFWSFHVKEINQCFYGITPTNAKKQLLTVLKVLHVDSHISSLQLFSKKPQRPLLTA
jgi:hypothetical protein